ncbi:uncharacterized protein DUF1501 [Roseimicrobium gellanilyticum]|uniref:Uncharacterized protein DUF1501 n=1 Tax=Roseimicrobium gellanilyticum TaxID=748857 RepID=A0A366HUV6_9BACT|nr:DUF1501 domain-containing protein [Roseimicrobium gellanilyticum]RBP46487.1 uncharacterized protein DUF1501 [Roseimicrobium gellanilyticum]
MPCHNYDIPTSRRQFLRRAGCGFGAVALAALMKESVLGAGTAPSQALARIPQHFGRAKSVIFCFMEGGPSHLDTFDRKPLLNQLAGQQLPPSFKEPVLAMGESGAPLLESRRSWKQYGQSGLWVSDWFQNVAEHADDLAVIHSCVSDGINHAGGVCQMNTGSIFGGRPSLGAWVNYGLGSANHDLPGFVVIKDSEGTVVNGVRNWGSGFMPAVHQGVEFSSDGQPIKYLSPPKGVSAQQQRDKLDLLAELNGDYNATRQDNTELEARIRAYELAYTMQAEAPQAVDLSKETEATKKLYGMDAPETAVYGRNCLLARRLVEHGVRFVQLYSGAGSKWDSHNRLEENHGRLCRAVDRPIAGLLTDLKQRGLLDETLVIWGGEFGRTPMSEQGGGRDHNPNGFTMWMAGGGVKGGQTIGATDELGLYAVQDKMHVHDLHSTILHLLGVDHTQLIYHHKGRPERIDQNEGHVNKALLG